MKYFKESSSSSRKVVQAKLLKLSSASWAVKVKLLKKSSEVSRHLWNTFQTTLRHFTNIFHTPFMHLSCTFQTSTRILSVTSHKDFIHFSDTFQTPSKSPLDIFQKLSRHTPSRQLRNSFLATPKWLQDTFHTLPSSKLSYTFHKHFRYLPVTF